MSKHPSERLRIALISEHASPLAVAGGVDSGGQNIYVNHVARELARTGHRVDVFTRRDGAALPPVVHTRPGMRVIHVPAGPARFVPKEKLLPYMAEFARHTEAVARGSGGYDVVHANFFMSGIAAMRLRRALGIPFVITLHALGLVRRQHQGADDGFPDDRIAIEHELVRCADRVIAECPQDRMDLMSLYGADAAHLSTVPCGYDPDEFGAGDRTRARATLGLASDEFVVLQLGRMVPRKGVDNVVRALVPLVREHGVNARLLVVGGEADTPCEIATPEIRRLRLIAEASGVGERVTFTGRVATSCVRSTTRPTPLSRRRGTSRSASRRSNRWRAARRWSAHRSAASSSRSSTASPASWCLRTTPRRWPTSWPPSAPTRRSPARWGAPACTGRARFSRGHA
jgi:glycosyltransferase involved in cell wall biosynthesis